MADGNYDPTNSGVFFQPHQDQALVGQGKLNIEGRDMRIVVVKERLGRDKPPQMVLYQRLGPLFTNDRKTSDRSPDKTGPLDDWPDHRIAAWKGEKDGRRYMSLKVSRKDDRPNTSGAQPNQGGGSTGWDDDDIPF